jgi:hypothetical protein
MKTYYKKSSSIKISWLSQKEFNKNSLCSRDYRELQTLNNNTYILSDFIISKSTWKEIGSDSYMKRSKYRFLKTVNISDWFLLDEARVEYCKPENKIFPKKWDILLVKDWWWSWLWEVWYYNMDNENNYDSLSSWLIRISVKKEKKFYILWLLKSKHFKTYIDLNTAQGSTIRHSKQIWLSYEIPFPSKNNHEEPEKIENFVSLIVQNLIDKEEQIKRKNEIIDEKIEKELRENQRVSEQVYKFPRISEIREDWRFDTWLYKEDYKCLYNLILDYKNKYFFLKKEDISWWNTPKKRIFEPSKKEYLWFTPTDINRWLLWEKKYIKSEKYNLWKDYCLLFSNRSNCWEGILYSPEFYNWWHHNQGIYRKQFNKNDLQNNIFILTLYNSSLYKALISDIATWATFPELRMEQYVNIPLPNFDDLKQEEIAKEYYNKIDKNNDLNFEDYLEKEKVRNKELWIFQLNMEIFILKEILENIVDKIVMDKKIDISFEY